jgi:hypothetical protein
MLAAMSDAEVIAAGKRVTRAAADLLLRHGLTDAVRVAGAAEPIGGHGAGERLWQFYRRYDAADQRARQRSSSPSG